MPFKIHPNQLRYALVAVNLILTLAVSWYGLWAFGFNKALWAVGLMAEAGGLHVKGFTPVEDKLPEYRIPDRTPKGTASIPAATIAELYEIPPPPKVVEIAGNDEPEEPSEVIDDNGPLKGKWELLSVIQMGLKAAIIGEVTATSRTSRYGVSSSRSRFSSSYRSRISSSYRSTTSRFISSRARGRKTATLFLYPPEDPRGWTKVGESVVKLISIEEEPGKPLSIVYMVQGENKKYRLSREEEEESSDPFAIEPPPEKEKPKSPFSKSPTGKSSTGSKAPGWDPGRIKLSGGSTAGKSTTSSSRSGSTITPRTNVRPVKKPTEADKRQLLDALKKIESKMSEKQRKQIIDAIRGKTKK